MATGHEDVGVTPSFVVGPSQAENGSCKASGWGRRAYPELSRLRFRHSSPRGVLGALVAPSLWRWELRGDFPRIMYHDFEWQLRARLVRYSWSSWTEILGLLWTDKSGL